MTTTLTALTVSASLPAAILLGMSLRRVFPAHHLSSDTQDTVKLAIGLVATMSGPGSLRLKPLPIQEGKQKPAPPSARGATRLVLERLRPYGYWLTLCLLVLVAPPVLAGESAYLSPGHPDGVALLAPPPVAGSAEAAADLASARAVFHARTPAEEAQAIKDANLSIFLFEPAIGSLLKPGNLPKTEALFQKVKKEVAKPIETVKNYWKRRRPYQVDERMALGTPENDFGYPSAHSTGGTVQALLLAELFPERKEAILKIGCELGWDRVLLGKHFPTDIYAGRVMGQALVRELLASPTFQHDLAEAKAEVRAAQH